MIPELVFIIPYRSREAHLNAYSQTMKYLLDEIKDIPYEMVVSEQGDNKDFNRGAMKNAGFIYIRNKYPNNYQNMTFVFNDVDLFPGVKGIIPHYITKKGVIKHFYGFTFALGGIFSILGSDFERVNGFPNYWGWGFEDNCIHQRALKNKITINRENFSNIGHLNWVHAFHGSARKLDNKVTHKYLEDKQNNNGISTIKITNVSEKYFDSDINMNKITINEWDIPEKFDEINYEINNNPTKILQNKVNMGDIMRMR